MNADMKFTCSLTNMNQVFDSHHKMFLAIVCVFAMVSSSSVHAQKSSNATTAQVVSSASPDSKPVLNDSVAPPFGADALEEKVLNLVGRHEGFVSKEEVEAAFGVTLRTTNTFGNAGYQADAYAKDPWYLKGNVNYKYFSKRLVIGNSVLNEGGVKSDLHINWGYFPGDPHLCLQPMKLASRLTGAGWKSVPYEAKPADFVALNIIFLDSQTGNARVAIFYSGDKGPGVQVPPQQACLTAVGIQGHVSYHADKEMQNPVVNIGKLRRIVNDL